MAIFKTGDTGPIINYYGDDGDLMLCTSCGRDLVIVAMDDENNRLVCECCDFDVDEGIGTLE